ncbi:MAG: amidohydrolase family protein [Chloroflexi bacterium]|nr:amidohydrolase family protein [Chloroflexota bacterium]
MIDLVIKGGKIVTHSTIVSAGIAIDKGRIVAVAGDELLPPAEKTIDATGKYVLPGLVDPHTHMASGVQFGIPYSVTARTETEAAALGGVTTVACYHRAVNTGLLKVLDKLKADFENNAVIDGFFHHMVADEACMAEIERCPEHGISGFKFSLGYRGPQAQASGIPPIDDGFLYEGFERISRLGYPARAMVHTENIDIALRLQQRLKHRQDARAWHDSRPNFVEEESMRKCLFLSQVTRCPLYVVHITIAEGVALIAEAKAEGIDVVGETCPQYLTHTSEEPVPVIANNPTFAVVNPPLRGKRDNEVLWQGIRDGVIDCIGSDLSLSKRVNKGTDMWKAPMGLANTTQLILPVMLSEGVNKGRIALPKVVEVCSYNPARVFGLYPQKGSIAVGSDADLVIVDLAKRVKMALEMSPSVCDWNIYEGWEFKGWPACTLVRGEVVAENGRIVTKPGLGRYVYPR